MNVDKSMLEQLHRILKEKTGTAAQIRTVIPVGGGSINHAYQLQTTAGSFFLKTRPDAPPSFFEREAEGLQLLHKAGAQVPAVFAVTSTFLLLEWIPKGQWTSSRMRALGRQLALVHQSQQPFYGLKNDNYIGLLPQPNRLREDWPTFFREQRLGPQYQSALSGGKIHPRSKRAKQMEQLLARLEEWLPLNPPAALLHGDLWSGNVLPALDGRNLLIDPAVYWGHHEVDLAFSQYFGGFSTEFYEGYAEISPLDPNFEDRKPIYQLYYILVHLNLFGEAYGPAVDAVLNRYVGG